MKSIAIFQADLNVGGIQRSLVNLLKSGVLNDFNVDVYLFSKKVFYDMGDLPNNIKMNYLNPFPYWYRFIPFGVIRKFHKKDKTFKEYDIVIDYDGYRQECAFYVTSIERARKIMWIHICRTRAAAMRLPSLSLRHISPPKHKGTWYCPAEPMIPSR